MTPPPGPPEAPEDRGRVPAWPTGVAILLVVASLVALTPLPWALTAGQTATAAAAGLVLWVALRRSRLEDRALWRPWCIAGALLVAGEATYLALQVIGMGAGASVVDLLFAAGMVSILVGSLRATLRDPGLLAVTQLMLDALAMALTAILLIWSLFLGQHLVPSLTIRQVLLLLYPAGDVMLAAALVLLATRTGPDSRPLMVWTAVALVAWTVADLLFAHQTLEGRTGATSLPLWAAGYALVATGLQRSPTPHPSRIVLGHPATLAYPSVLVFLAVPVVVWAIVRTDTPPLAVLVVGPFLFLTIITRQFLALYENRLLVQDLSTSEEQLSSIIEQSADLILLHPLGGPIAFASPASKQVLGYAPEELMGQDPLDLVHTEDRARSLQALSGPVGSWWSQDLRCRRRDGEWAWVSMRGRTYRSGDDTWAVLTLRDETERRNGEEVRRALERNIRVRGLINRMLVHAKEEPAFLKEACDALAQTGGYPVAWIGQAEPDGAVTVVAQAGDRICMEEVQARWDDTPQGQGPTGRAIQSGEGVVVHDISRERRYGRWREVAARHGHAASAAFPLDLGGGARGVLNLCSRRSGAFDEAELGLLEEIAQDLAFGVRSLRERKARQAAERRAVRQQQMMEAAEAMAHVGSWQYDVDHDEYTVSGETYRIFGLPPGQPLAIADLEEAIHPEDRDRVMAARGTLLSGSAYDETYRILRTDGAVRWVRSRARLQGGGEGPKRLVGQIQDITEQVEAQQALQRQESFMVRAERAAHLASWEFDSRTGESTLSENGYALFGFDPDHPILTQQVFDAMHEEDRPRVRRSGEQALAMGTPHAVEFRFHRTDGALRWGRIDAVAVADATGERRFLRGVIQDITERRQAEAAAREAEARERELHRLQEMNEFRARFMNTAAHELNQPITPLALETDLLRKGALGPLNEKQARAVELLDRNLTRMSLLVQDMLDAARMQAGRLKLSLDVADVAEVVRDAVETFSEQARKEGIRLRSDLPSPLSALVDRRRIMQVASNLVHNAIKFTPKGGTITIKGTVEEDQVVVSVQDTGVGLSGEQIGRLFQPFIQVHEEPPKGRRGTGLGLYISHGIIEEHGGTLAVTSPGPGKGATFTFRLPIGELTG